MVTMKFLRDTRQSQRGRGDDREVKFGDHNGRTRRRCQRTGVVGEYGVSLRVILRYGSHCQKLHVRFNTVERQISGK